MIISRTPFRISLAGGGSDLRSFYQTEPGKVLSTSINKYIYVVVKRQVGLVEFKYRVNWSQVEFRNNIDDIEHPIVRETLKYLNIQHPVEITTFADIPANTGLGSSSAFAVGLVNALYALKGEHVTKHKLASEAAHIEVDILGRSVGKQDHFASSYGGLNIFTFHQDESVSVDPVFYSSKVWAKLQKRLLLFYTGLKRDASEILESHEMATPDTRKLIRELKSFVEPMREALCSGGELDEVGRLLNQGWEVKRSLTSGISNAEINNYYSIALDTGAVGGKLLGAGGGGFLLFYAPQSKQKKVREALGDLYCLDFRLDSAGSRITYYDQSEVEFS